jgi:hypothetical protein
MGIPVSLLLIAIGAILAFAVTDTSNAIDVPTVGWILMATGFFGLLLSLIMWDTWAGGGYWRHRTYQAAPVGPARRRIVEEDVPTTRRRVVQEEIEDAGPPAPPPPP